MITSLSNFLTITKPYLSQELVSSQNLYEIDAISQSLPLASKLYFECVLNEEEAKSDFSVEITPSDCWQVLNEYNLKDSAKNINYAHPIWQSIGLLCHEWSNHGSIIHKGVSRLCLEFDIGRQRSPIVVPNIIFFGMDIDDQQQQIEVVKQVFHYFDEQCVPSNYVNILCHQLKQIPLGAGEIVIGAQFLRNTKSLRLMLGSLSLEQQVDFLSRVGWKGSKVDLQDTVKLLADKADRICLAFDIGERILDKVGIEFYIDAYDKSRWQAMLDSLVNQSLCCSNKYNALLTWMGVAIEKSEQSIRDFSSPKRLNRPSENLVNAFIRWLSHVKIAYDPGKPLEAKVYPIFTRRWLKMIDADL